MIRSRRSNWSGAMKTRWFVSWIFYSSRYIPDAAFSGSIGAAIAFVVAAIDFNDINGNLVLFRWHCNRITFDSEPVVRV
nr:hypothetical protein Itr_chr11CG02860 [Ipomoea trifida]